MYSIQYPNILISLVLAFTLIIYTYSLYIVKKKNKLHKLLLLNTYNGRECNVILGIVLHEK